MGVKSGRDWILTISAEKHTIDEVRDVLSKYRWIGQLEQGKEHGFKHFQVAILNDNSIRFETLQKKFGDAHIEPRHGSRQELFDYCTKDDTRLDGPWRGGDWSDTAQILKRGSEQGRRSDLTAVREAVDAGLSYRQVLLDPDLGASSAHAMQWLRETVEAKREQEAAGKLVEKTVLFVCESVMARQSVRESLYEILKPEELYEADSLTRFDSYDGQRVMIFPEFDWRVWPADFVTRLCDRYPMKLPARYKNKQLMADTVIFLSHEPITSFYQGFLGLGRAKLFSLIDCYWEIGSFSRPFDVELKKLYEADSKWFTNVFSAQRPWKLGEMKNGQQYMIFARSGGEGSESLPLLEEQKCGSGGARTRSQGLRD